MSNENIADYKKRVAKEQDDINFTSTKKNAINNLDKLISGILKGNFNKLSPSKKVEAVSQKLKLIEKDNIKYKAEETTYMALYEEYLKIDSLKAMSINKNNDYCSINVNVGGVTEKVTLVKKNEADERLSKIAKCQNLSDFNKLQQQNLNPAGMLKLPKHGKILEVQREAIALKVADIIFSESDSTVQMTKPDMVSYRDNPALFIEFDKIIELEDISEKDKKTQHNSLLKPVGERVQPNHIVKDFGKTLAYFYLCGDPDAIGKNGQNKAITNSDHDSGANNIYLFDQVVMPKTRMKIDSRLKIQPTGILRHSRHFRFRNRSLIEDNDFDDRFNSLSELQDKREDINQLMDEVINGYKTKIKKINPHWYSFLKPDDRKTLKQYKALKKDAQKLKKVLNKRIDALDNVLPKLQIPKNNQDLKRNKDEIKKGAVILETLLNKPTLYNSKGHPYRAPHTYRNNLAIKRIKINKSGIATIQFNGKIDRVWIKHIRECHGAENDMNVWVKHNTIQIPVDQLKKIQFEKVFPELKNQANYQGDLKKYDLLNIKSLQNLNRAYDSDNTDDKVTKEINSFNKKYQSLNSNKEKIELLNSTRKALVELRKQSKNKGFSSHILRRFDLAAQQHLFNVVSDDTLKTNMKKAFERAIKLDRVDSFNQVCQKAIDYGFTQKNNPGYEKFKNIVKDFISEAETDLEKDCKEILGLDETWQKRLKTYQENIVKEKANIDNHNPSGVIKHRNAKPLKKMKKKSMAANSNNNNNEPDPKTSTQGLNFNELNKPMPPIKIKSDSENNAEYYQQENNIHQTKYSY